MAWALVTVSSVVDSNVRTENTHGSIDAMVAFPTQPRSGLALAKYAVSSPGAIVIQEV